ncbi:MAG: hypothetical protein WCO23_00545 [bacterium]
MLHKKPNRLYLETSIAYSNFPDAIRIERAIDGVRAVLETLGLNRLLSCTKVVVMGHNLVYKHRITSNQRLMIFGFIGDLTDTALIGLVVHLFGLIAMDFDKNFPVKGEDRLKNDLIADELAKEWGFREEIEAFRKARPYGTPKDFEYPGLVLNCSKYNQKFSQLVDNFLANKKILQQGHVTRIIYTERFSLVCDLRALKDQSIGLLIIINNFNNMKEDELDKILKEVI